VRHLPNLICLIRLALVWPIAAALASGNCLLALALFMAAAVSDGLDGYLAKRFNWTSALGKFLDPLADKLFRLWFGPLRGRPTIISKIKTAAQLLYLMAVMFSAAVGFPPREILDALALLTLVTILLSAYHYMATFTRRAWSRPAQPS
jgi:cardiolipin synthase